MKLLTLNIAGGKDWDSRKAAVLAMLETEKADIVLLQEVHFDKEKSGYSQAVDLNNALGVPYQYVASTITKFYVPSSGGAFREGLAVLSKYPIMQSEALALAKAEDDKHTRIVQLLNIQKDDQMVNLANVHLSNNRHSTKQLEELLQILAARGEQPIIAGDLNILSVQQVRDIASMYNLAYDTQPYVSFVSEDITIDHVLVSRGTTFISIKAIDNLSDHSAVMCEIKEEK